MGPFQSIEEIPSRYQFVHVVARRARKLQGGARPQLPPTSRKPTRIAQQEAMGGLIEFTHLKRDPEDGSESGENG